MRIPFASHPSPISAPIKGYSRKGFAIGWLAIVLVAAAGFAFATLTLSQTSPDLRVAERGAVERSLLPRG